MRVTLCRMGLNIMINRSKKKQLHIQAQISNVLQRCCLHGLCLVPLKLCVKKRMSTSTTPPGFPLGAFNSRASSELCPARGQETNEYHPSRLPLGAQSSVTFRVSYGQKTHAYHPWLPGTPPGQPTELNTGSIQVSHFKWART